MSLLCLNTNLNVKYVLFKHSSFSTGFDKNYYCKRVCFLYYRMFSSKYIFNPDQKEQFIERLSKFKIKQNPTSTLQNAAVLVPFCKVNGEMSLLYTLRKLNLKTHKGQVSFPGGKQDSKDCSLEVTALRETEEELGISKGNVEIWGQGNVIIGREYNILPVVGYVGDIDIDNLKPNLAEVEFAFTIPLSHFYDLKNCKFTQFRNRPSYTLPVFINTKCKVWGITALITHTVLRAFSPKKYLHEISVIKL